MKTETEKENAENQICGFQHSLFLYESDFSGN